ncbi:MAG: hypothetical protein WBV82_30980 [Myxococcaceae bacterium]
MTCSIVRVFVLAVAVATLGSCAATVGDPCTTPSDCGSGLCLNQASTPGGYCTQQCLVTNPESCPSGTVCIRTDAEPLNAVCLRECQRDDDCREGYTCRQDEGWPRRVCMGPGEL